MGEEFDEIRFPKWPFAAHTIKFKQFLRFGDKLGPPHGLKSYPRGANFERIPSSLLGSCKESSLFRGISGASPRDQDPLLSEISCPRGSGCHYSLPLPAGHHELKQAVPSLSQKKS